MYDIARNAQPDAAKNINTSKNGQGEFKATNRSLLVLGCERIFAEDSERQRLAAQMRIGYPVISISATPILIAALPTHPGLTSSTPTFCSALDGNAQDQQVMRVDAAIPY
eukprot:jgi/Mesvir1/9049/Mv21328-RA.1